MLNSAQLQGKDHYLWQNRRPHFIITQNGEEAVLDL